VPPPPAPLFTPVAFEALPGWQQDDLRQAWPAFMPPAACWSQGRLEGACAAAAAVDGGDGAAIRRYFETYFVPNQVRAADGADTGLITGYYEPMLRGARKRGGAYQTPLYKVPDDLLTVDLASVYPSLKGMRLRGRLVGKTVVPYSTRAEIERARTSPARNCSGSTIRSKPSSSRCRVRAACSSTMPARPCASPTPTRTAIRTRRSAAGWSSRAN
jgi:membrane-bound lytic murein transglycosylase A